jgi:hypothetical protein
MEKLNAAFAELEKLGILTRHNYWCCGGCASGAIANEYEANPQSSIIGGVYYHEQGAEFAIKGRGLGLHYGCLPDASGRTREVGEKLAAALKVQGLTVNWNGNPSDLIKVKPFAVRLDEVPEGEHSTLHQQYGEDDDY